MDSIESVLSNSSKIMIEVKEGNNVMLLPLDKIINSNGMNEEAEDDTTEEYTSSETNNREGR